MNVRNTEREEYIYQQRKFGKRSFAEIGRELGITGNRVRQIYVRIDWAKNRYDADHHQKKKTESKLQEIKAEAKRPGLVDEFMYRMPMPVDQPNGSNEHVCPRCGKTLLKYQQNFCEHCGQKLEWNTQQT